MKLTKTVRAAGWLAVVGLLAASLIAPAGVLAAGPGNNGLDATGNGTKSNATVGGSLSDAAGSATMDADAVMSCDGTSVGSVGGHFTLNKTLDAGSTITVYMVPNNGSNADPIGNVTKNEATVTFSDGNRTSGTDIAWTVNVTSPFTVSSGGILVVFAVNDDGTTAISSSKTNSLNCTEAQPTPTTPVATPTEPVATPTEPVATPTEPVATPTEPVATPTEPVATPTEPVATPTEPVATPTGSIAPESTPSPSGAVEGETGTPQATPPATDTIGSTGGPSDNGWRVLALVLAGFLASILVLTPAPRSTRR